MGKAILLPADVVIDSRRFQIQTLVESLQNQEILIPICYHWPQKEESRFIESILLRVPLGPIYLEELDDGRYGVIDGAKRMNAILHMLCQQRKFCSLAYYSRYNDMYVKQLEKHHQRRVLETSLMIHAIGKNVPQAVKDDLVMRLQT